MIAIDGNYQEGGGQIIRTAVGLSAITGTSVHIYNIRKGREKPGLKPQHLEGIKAAAQICGAQVEGARLNSQEIKFCPGKIKGGTYLIDTKTAGSITLILQALTPIGIFSDSGLNLTIRGGTAVPYSPTIEYYQHIFCAYLRLMGISTFLETKRHGFYPAGGGEVFAEVNPANLKNLNLIERGDLQKIDVLTVASNHLKKTNVAERMIDGFRKYFKEAHFKVQYVDTASPGCFIRSHAHFEHGRLGADALGKKGMPAERVGVEAGRELKTAIKSESPFDPWMVDQIIPYLALAAVKTKTTAQIRIPSLSKHAETNIWVVEQLLPVDCNVKDNYLLCELKNESN